MWHLITRWLRANKAKSINPFLRLLEEWTFDEYYAYSPDKKHKIWLCINSEFSSDRLGALYDGLTPREQEQFYQAAVSLRRQRRNDTARANLEYQKGIAGL